MKIISWNVNSVRARINNILDYIKDEKPDILMLNLDVHQKDLLNNIICKLLILMISFN